MGHDSGNRLILEVPRNGNFDVVLRLIAEALKSPSGSTDNTKLSAIVEMLRDLAGVPAQLGLLKEQVAIIHKLVADLVIADPERLKELAEQLKSYRSSLAESIKQQTEGEK